MSTSITLSDQTTNFAEYTTNAITFSDGTNSVTIREPTTISGIYDFFISSNAGAVGQILARTASGSQWQDAGTVPNPFITSVNNVGTTGQSIVDSVIAPNANLKSINSTSTALSVTNNPTTHALDLAIATGTSASTVTIGNDQRLFQYNTLYVTKQPIESGSTNRFATIQDALTYASSQSPSGTNPFVIQVSPGVYTEVAPIVMLPFVFIQGSGYATTTVMPTVASSTLVIGSERTCISNMQLTGASTAISFAGVSNNDTPFVIANITFGNCTTLVSITNNNPAVISLALAVNCRAGGPFNFTTGFEVVTTGGAYAQFAIVDCQFRDSSSPFPNDVIYASGLGASMFFSTTSMRVIGGNGNAIHLTNGAYLATSAVFIAGFLNGIYVDNAGVGPTLRVSSTNIENNTANINIENSLTSGYIEGIFRPNLSYIHPDAPVNYVNSDRYTVNVSKNDFSFNTITSAIQFITPQIATSTTTGSNAVTGTFNVSLEYATVTGPGIPAGTTFHYLTPTTGTISNNATLTATNTLTYQKSNAAIPFTIEVAPGTYSEPTIQMPAYTILTGVNSQNTIVQCTTPSATATIDITNAQSVSLQDITITGGTATTTIYCVNSQVWMHNVRSTAAPRGLYVNSSYVDVLSYETDATITDIGIYIDGTTGTSIDFEGKIIDIVTGTTANYGVYITGTLAEDVNLNGTITGTSPNNTVGLYFDNGAAVTTKANVAHCNIAIQSGNVGIASLLQASSVLLDSNTIDLQFDHPGTYGMYNGQARRSATNIVAGAPISLVYQDANVNSLTIVGDIYTGHNNTITTSTLPLIESTSMGLISGGTITIISGLTIQVAAGSGYVLISTYPNHQIKYVSWADTQLTLAASTLSYISINSTGTPIANVTPPQPLYSIPLGFVNTLAASIEVVSYEPYFSEQVSEKFNVFNRTAIGPLFSTGSIVSYTGLTIGISSGIYFISDNEYQPAGLANPASFYAYYHNSLTTFTRTLQSAVDNVNYDNGTGLAPIPAGEYAKHSLYITGAGAFEQYFLVYSQNVYATLGDALSGSVPLPPPYFTGTIVIIAAIVVQEGNSSIVQVISQRPIIGSNVSQVASTTVHGSLLGLAADDHCFSDDTMLMTNNGLRTMDTFDTNNDQVLTYNMLNNSLEYNYALAKYEYFGYENMIQFGPALVTPEHMMIHYHKGKYNRILANRIEMLGLPTAIKPHNAEDLTDIAIITICGILTTGSKTTYKPWITNGVPTRAMQYISPNSTLILLHYMRGKHIPLRDAAINFQLLLFRNGITNYLQDGYIFPRMGVVTYCTCRRIEQSAYRRVWCVSVPNRTVVAYREGQFFICGNTQYILGSGTRAFTGDVNIGGNNIINVALVDGVDVPAHASRHLPNGADPITTAAPTTSLSATTTNAVGIANSLARSDHTHAITTGPAASQQPDQVNATGTASTLARSDHTHNIPTAAPTTTLSASTTNSQGIAATFARSDHTHAISLSGFNINTALTGYPLLVSSGGTGLTTIPSGYFMTGAGSTINTTKVVPSGVVVGTTDIQNLTNKSLESTSTTIYSGTTTLTFDISALSGASSVIFPTSGTINIVDTTTSQVLINKTLLSNNNTVAAKYLWSSTVPVSVDTTDAVANYALIATSSTAATWQPITTAIISGILPITNGGTGVNSFTTNAIIYCSTPTTLASSSNWSYNGNNVILTTTASTVAPGALIVQGSQGTEQICSISTSTSGFRSGFARGTIASPTTVLSSDILGSFSFMGYNGTQYQVSAYIRGVAAETFSGTANGTDITFSTASIGSTTISESMRLSNAGNLGIGTITPSTPLHVIGNATITGISTGFVRSVAGLLSGSPLSTADISTALGFTSGSVVFAGTSGTISQNNTQFYWNNTNGYLGLGTNTPVARLNINGVQSIAAHNGVTGVILAATGSITDTDVSIPPAVTALSSFSGSISGTSTYPAVATLYLATPAGSITNPYSLYCTGNGLMSGLTISLFSTGFVRSNATGILSSSPLTAADIGAALNFNTGSVLFIDSLQQVAQNNSRFYWDNTLFALGIGTNTLPATLSILGGIASGTRESAIRVTTSTNLITSIGIELTNTAGSQYELTSLSIDAFQIYRGTPLFTIFGSGSTYIGTTPVNNGYQLEVANNAKVGTTLTIGGMGAGFVRSSSGGLLSSSPLSAADINTALGLTSGGVVYVAAGALTSTPASLAFNGTNMSIGTAVASRTLNINAGCAIDISDSSTGPGLSALTFGSTFTEGITSKRSAGGNQNGIDIYTNSISRISITSAGQVGIGVSPTKQLTIAGSGTDGVLVTTSGNPGASLYAGTLGLYSGGILTASINASGSSYVPGSFGIGISTPSTALHVVGGAMITGLITGFVRSASGVLSSSPLSPTDLGTAMGLSAGSIVYAASPTALTGSTLFQYNSSISGLGIGGAATSKLQLIGDVSAPAWTTSGIAIRVNAANYTDTSSTSTVPLVAISALGAATILSSNPVTYSTAATLTLSAPVAGTGATITNAYAIYTTSNSYFGNLNANNVLFRGLTTNTLPYIAGTGYLANATLTNLQLTAGTLNLTTTTVTPGTYTAATITVDAYGRITSASSGGVGSGYYIQGGNAFGTLATLGTTDNNDLAIITNNTEKMRITATGSIGIATNAPSNTLDVNGSARVRGLTSASLVASDATGVLSNAVVGNGLTYAAGTLSTNTIHLFSSSYLTVTNPVSYTSILGSAQLIPLLTTSTLLQITGNIGITNSNASAVTITIQLTYNSIALTPNISFTVLASTTMAIPVNISYQYLAAQAGLCWSLVGIKNSFGLSTTQSISANMDIQILSSSSNVTIRSYHFSCIALT